MGYNLKSLKVPRLAGAPLKSIVALLENGTTRQLLAPTVLRETGVARIRQVDLPESPAYLARYETGRPPSIESARKTLGVFDESGFQGNISPLPGILDIARSYRSGAESPSSVAEKVIAAMAAFNAQEPQLNAVLTTNEQDIRYQAGKSEQRFAAGQPLGLLDGIPVIIKDEIDAVPYATTVGTRIYGADYSADQDATVVARLRAAGAIIIGKASMQEIGIGVTGANSHYGHCRNPHNMHHYSGGSSSGSAASVAAGLCPLAIGADGGGSIRIPASLCGLAGLKPTWGRISEYGAFPLCWSVAHIGPMAQTVDDVALAYACIAGPDDLDPYSKAQPPVHLSDYLNADLSGITLGLFPAWFSHGSREVVQQCQLAVETLKSLGATVRHLEIDDLDLQRIAHAVIISSEMMSAVDTEYRSRHRDFGLDTRLNLALSQVFSSRDYLKALKVRRQTMQEFAALFEKVDMIVSPTTGMTAPPVPPRSKESAESNLQVLTELMRFAFPANLAGLPALTVPVGYDQQKLPIGLQLMGRPWQEHLLLRCGRALESRMDLHRARHAVDLLS